MMIPKQSKNTELTCVMFAHQASMTKCVKDIENKPVPSHLTFPGNKC